MNFTITHYKLILFFVTIFIVSCISMYFSIMNTSINCDQNCELIINRNENAFDVAKRLDSLNFIDGSYSFILASKFLSLDKSIKPGYYDLSEIKNMRQLIFRLIISDGDYVKTTIPEGWSIEQISDNLYNNNLIDINRFKKLCYDTKFIQSLGLNRKINSLEGYLFPETYFFSSEQTEEQILEMMVNQFIKVTSNEKLKENRFNFSIHDIITLASIIEGESMHKDEMKIISSVFHNRLNKKMYLDANATIQYIIPGKNRRLLNRDLEVVSPYNTYKNKGLPPGPINNPGLDAIIAAINPEKTSYLYFVKDPDTPRKHVFNKTSKKHEIARKKYLKSLRNK